MIVPSQTENESESRLVPVVSAPLHDHNADVPLTSIDPTSKTMLVESVETYV